MATKKKMLQAAAGNAGGAGLNVEDVFSTYLYEGNGSTQTITNGIDLDGEGGMVWIKGRNFSDAHALFDTERGFPTWLVPNDSALDDSFGTPDSSDMVANSDGFSINNISSASNSWNSSGNTFASWTFRKAPKFFDVVTYTGDGVAGREIAHNLGSVPGMVIVKKRSGGFGDGWVVNHRSIPSTQFVKLDGTQAATTTSTRWNDTDPTDTVFTVGNDTSVNYSGYTYVAYLFAHNDGDGEFGPDGDADIIKCGSYTGNGSTDGPEIDLGFEPQWLLVKAAERAQGWDLYDSMRGIPTGAAPASLQPNSSSAEFTDENGADLTANGFKVQSSNAYCNASGETYIYIAIRRGTKVPESGTEVFEVTGDTNANAPWWSSGFPVDMAFFSTTGVSNKTNSARLIQGESLNFNLTDAEFSSSAYAFDYQDGWYSNTGASSGTWHSWMWKRAPNFFDVVTHTGDGVSGRQIPHNLGVAPDMIWTKNRTSAYGWKVGGVGLGFLNTDARLNSTPQLDGGYHGASSETYFTVNSYLGFEALNQSGDDYVSYLFASIDGISKVGSYTGNGSSQTIDCGFTSGARFILIKRTDSTGDWYVWDTERGIVAGNDPYLELNTQDVEVTSTDWVDPDNSGFIVNGTTINASSAEYIFYAIA